MRTIMDDLKLFVWMLAFVLGILFVMYASYIMYYVAIVAVAITVGWFIRKFVIPRA